MILSGRVHRNPDHVQVESINTIVNDHTGSVWITAVQSGPQRFSLDHDGAGWHRKGPETRSCAPRNQTHVELFGLVWTRGSGRQTMQIRPTIITKWRGGGGGRGGRSYSSTLTSRTTAGTLSTSSSFYTQTVFLITQKFYYHYC